MDKSETAPQIVFHVSPSLNLYYSLEVATGTIIEAYDEEYALKMKKIFPYNILKRFKELHEPQRYSFRVKTSLFNGISVERLKNSMLTLSSEFYELLKKAYPHYEKHWNEIGSALLKAKNILEKQKAEYGTLISSVSNLLKIPWEIEELRVQLVDPFTGEPIGRNIISLGIGSIASLPASDLATVSSFFILHEATHILVGDIIRKTSKKYTTEEHSEYIDEAVMNLISSSVLNREIQFKERFGKSMDKASEMNFPPTSHLRKTESYESKLHRARHAKRNHYIKYYKTLLQDDWDEMLTTNYLFPSLMKKLLENNIADIRH